MFLFHIIAEALAFGQDQMKFFSALIFTIVTVVTLLVIYDSRRARAGEKAGLLAQKQKQAPALVEETGDVQYVPPAELGDWKCMVAACALGIVNNNAYCIVTGAAQSLAKDFGTEDLMALFSTIMLISCTVATLMNSAVCLKITVHKRILMILLMNIGGFMMLALSTWMGGIEGFIVSSAACILVGVSQMVGEITMLPWFSRFPACVLGAWGAGTGIAGIMGSSLYLFLKGVGLSNAQIFCLLIPTALLYYMAFTYLVGRASKFESTGDQQKSKSEPAELTFENLVRVIKYTGPILFNMVAVYVLEYSIYPGLVDRDTLCPIDDSFMAVNAFTMMWTCYNVGVTISRGSVGYMQTDKLWLFTTLQFLNCAGWVYEAFNHTILNTFGRNGIYVLFVWMVFVGLMGGACYSNCVNAFNTRKIIPADVRELGINLSFTCANGGVMMATMMATMLHNSVMSSEALFPNGCPATL